MSCCNNPNTRLLMRLIVDILLLSSVFTVALIILPQLLRTRYRGFFCGDESIAYPFKQETLLKRIHVTILVIAIPAAMVIIIEMLRVTFPAPKSSTSTAKIGHVPKPPQRYVFVGVRIPTFVSECYNIMGVYLFGLALVLIASSCTKHFTGRLAPYFMDVCQPLMPANVTACSDPSHFGRFIEYYTCSSLTITPHLMNTMRQSFPSTHSATTAYAMFFLAIYMQVRLKTGWMKLWRCLMQFCAIVIAILVALERVGSYRHHWTDVAMGIFMGALMAFFMTMYVSPLFKKVPIKVRRIRDDTSNMYGYYTVMPKPRYFV
ncbi:putative phosphatidate phosphatase [Haematobia irritans]|uniref:putative phosphatidate phosphatase n=1 Tax=Haematobia irritans TaxID=7368 RepID=UPI003F5023DD